jgi:hypothetical protein
MEGEKVSFMKKVYNLDKTSQEQPVYQQLVQPSSMQ